MTKQLIAAVSIIGILASTASCRSTPPAINTPQPAAAAPAPALPDGIRWVRDSVEYQAAVLQTYRAATTNVELAARGRQPGSWAVVLDADETVISNVQYQIERAQARLTFTPDSWHAWIARREATPMLGAADFPRPASATSAAASPSSRTGWSPSARTRRRSSRRTAWRTT